MIMMLSDHVLYLDGEAIVLDKPAGMPVTEPRSGQLAVENYFNTLTFGFQRQPMIVHRLDQDTSGCLMLARNPKAQKRFNKAFEEGEVVKTYLAVLSGVPKGEGGLIEIPLSKVSSADDGWRMVGDPKGKAAVTRWRLLSIVDGLSLVEFKPKTGRTHQLRVHAKEGLGLPIGGDPVYGTAHKAGMMLHASTLNLPRSGKQTLEAHAPMPDRFKAFGFSDAG
jgi:tRNA pseudouridine32 synthase / 23S rRNA pseudouridine746 synthase